MSVDLLNIAQTWRSEGRQVAMAVVAKTWGSAPFPVGSMLICDESGHFEGSVSGGCIEGEVITEAMECLKDGGLRRLEYGIEDDTAWRVGLACGGTIRLFVMPLPEQIGDIINADAQRHSVALVTALSSGETLLIDDNNEVGFHELDAAIHQAMTDDKSQMWEDSHFIRVFNAQRQLFIVGAVHIAQTLVPMASPLGFDITVIDPRGAFASPERFPDINLSTEWPDEVLNEMGVDRRTAVVTLTHDPKLDDPALEAALRSEAFYIGSLGSSRTHAKRVDRLTQAGFSEAEIAKIHGPIGLDIGAKSPGEIAVSILAQLVAAMRGKPTR